MNSPVNAPCFCGATDYDVAATGTLLQCRKCGRVWTRASGAWAAADFIKLEFEAPATVTYTPKPTDKPGEPITLVWKKP